MENKGGDGNANRGNLRQTSIPDASTRLCLSSPSGPTSILQSNRFTRLANVTWTKANASSIPGHFLLPDPKGMYLKSFP